MSLWAGTVCEHEEFEAAIVFNRFVDDHGTFNGAHMDVRARCVRCHQPVTWAIPDGGLAPDRATVSADRQELRVPCQVTLPGTP